MESVSTKYLSLYGGKYATTPELEAEKAHALVFDNFYAHVTNTANSLLALTLSVYPPGLSHKEPTVETPAMRGTSLADVLKARGYRTAFISSGDNQYANQAGFLKNRGFDQIWDWRDSGRQQMFTWGVADDAMVDMIFRWLDLKSDSPFFVMAWNQGTHHPYENWDRKKIDFFKGNVPHDDWDLGNYLNAIHELDVQIKRIFDGLRERGLAEDTIVVMTGDHGEAFGDPHRFYGHSYNVYEEDVHVPLVIWSPGLYSAPVRNAIIGGHVDLAPTILDLLGVESPGDWQGTSLFAHHHPSRAYSYGRRDYYVMGIREGPLKYVFKVSEGEEALYDLRADPLEQRNVAAEQPEAAARLRQRLAAWFSYQGHR